MRILLIGAGAVGQVYGVYLQRAGAQVDCLVRAKYVSQARSGFKLYRLESKRSHEAFGFTPQHVYSDTAELEGEAFDQIWLCVPSGALSDDWLRSLAAVVPSSATIVSLQPGIDVASKMRAHFGERAIVSGLIGMVSYQTPLVGDARELPAGVAFYLPRLAPSAFSGSPEAASWIVRTLKQHGCPARLDRDAAETAALSSCLLMPHMVALEAADWSLASMWRQGLGVLAAQACREATVAVAHQLGIKPPLYRFLLRAVLFRIIFSLAARFAPFALEPYLAYHFGKVRQQTRLMMISYRAAASRLALPDDAMNSLHERVFGSQSATGTATLPSE
jgi:2-dehydropantoate 2-reductase